MNWITKNIFFGSVPDVVNDGVNFISNQIIKLFDKDIELLTTKEISAAVLATTSVASMLVVVMAFKLIFTTYVTETEGDPDADPIQIWVKVSVVLALINSNDFIYVTFQKLSSTFTKDLVGSISCSEYFNAVRLTITLLTKQQDGISALITIVVSVICVLIIAFKAGIRAGELVLFKTLWSIVCIDKLSANSERFNAFFSSYVVTYFGYSIQLFCLRLAFNRMIAGMTNVKVAELSDYFAAIVFFYLAICTPKWLEKFAYSSGIGQKISNGARTASFMIPSLLMRR